MCCCTVTSFKRVLIIILLQNRPRVLLPVRQPGRLRGLLGRAGGVRSRRQLQGAQIPPAGHGQGHGRELSTAADQEAAVSNATGVQVCDQDLLVFGRPISLSAFLSFRVGRRGTADMPKRTQYDIMFEIMKHGPVQGQTKIIFMLHLLYTWYYFASLQPRWRSSPTSSCTSPACTNRPT